MKKKILLSIIILILMGMTVFTLFTTSSGYTEVVEGIRWHYDVVDGEAVNVYIPSRYSESNITELTIPSTLGGYPVTEITGVDFSTNGRYDNMLGEGGWYYDDGSLVTAKVQKVNIPNTVKTIGNYAFYNCPYLAEVNFPSSLERIDNFAFYKTALRKVKLDGIDIISPIAFSEAKVEEAEFLNMEQLTGFGNSTYLKKITLGDGIKTISNFGNCPNLENVQIPSSVKTLDKAAFRGMTDIYVDNYETDMEITSNVKPLTNEKLPYIHFKNQERITTSLPEGVKIINTQNNEIVSDSKFATGSDVTLKLEKDDSVDIQDYIVFIETDGKYAEDEKIVEQIDWEFGENYTIRDLQRNKKIYVQTRKNGFDLALRQYITKINSKDITTPREPIVEIKEGQAKYLHTKNTIYPKTGDKITYCIRVYNEGMVDGTANIITQHIPEGLKFDEDSQTNSTYNWKKSEDGRTATTEYLKDKTITKYTIYDIDYKDIYIDLIVDLEGTSEMTRLVTISQIYETSMTDVDSTPRNFELPVDSNYKQTESEQSNEKSYITGIEDDDDYENVATSYEVPIPHSLVIKKIDGLDNQLLNGATFELLDENKNVLRSGITAEGGNLNLGTIYSFGLGKTTYFLREKYTPEGYKNHLKYLIQLDIINEYSLSTGLNTRAETNIQEIDIDTSIYNAIQISTKEELKAIQNNVDKKYVLANDIDLTGENWTPLNVSNVKLDGKGYKIKNLKIQSNSQTSKTFGLFGNYSGIIENLTLENVDINVTRSDGEDEQIEAVGALIGYAQNTVLKNINVTGKIESNIRNVGGIVGHTKSKNILVARNCTNEATITATSHNIGGILGCGLGPVKMYNNKNNGQINAKSYNAGGLIGYIRPEGYDFTRVFTNYDSDNQVLTLAIKNDSITGKYQFRIQKIDTQGNLLDGAKFQILDNSKQVIEGYENVELKNGVIEFEPQVINSIGKDVYYLKEIEAPEGYVKITDHYIKIIIDKKWDKEENEYYTQVNSKELTVEEFEQDSVDNKNTSDVKTGLIYSKPSENVVSNIIELDIRDSENNAVVTNEYEYTVTGGLVGGSKGRTTIMNSNNKAKVSARGGNPKTAGIIGSIEKQENTNIALLKECSNSSTVEGISTNEEGTTAGILAFARVNVINVQTCENTGEILGTSTACCGILGNGLGQITVSDSNNKGKIEEIGCSSEVAGILAKSKWVDNETIDIVKLKPVEIINCINEANLSGYGQIAGIVGQTNTTKLTVKDCYVNNSNIRNLQTVDNNSKCAGIVGVFSGYEDKNIDDLDSQILNINNCKVKNSNILSKTGDTAGVVAFGGTGREDITNLINIGNCNVEDTKIICEGIDESTNIAVSGLFGQSYEVKNINVFKCNVVNTDIKYGIEEDIQASNVNVAGIYGMNISYSSGIYANITDVNVKKCNVINRAYKGEYSNNNTAGIMAETYLASTTNGYVNISGSNVEETNINSASGNVGGIYNVASGGDGYGEKATSVIKNSTVNKTKINSSGIGQSSTTCISVGGIAGETNLYTMYQNCDVIASEIKTAGGNSGGIVGHVFNSAVLKDCDVLDTDILVNEEINTYSGVGQTGGIAGIIMTNANISDCSVKGINKKIKLQAGNLQLGGIAGTSIDAGQYKIDNCTVDNADMQFAGKNYGNSYSNLAVGGIISGLMTGRGNDRQIQNCSVTNTEITSNATSTGGIIGYANLNIEDAINKCKVENVNIKTTNEKTSFFGASAGGIVGDGAVQEIKDSIVKNLTIETDACCVGGISGSLYSETKYENIVIEGLNITHNNTSEKTSVKGVGGVSGVSVASTIENIELKDITINAAAGTSIIHVGGIGGYSGIKTVSFKDKTSGIEMNNASGGTTGGLFGYNTGTLTIENTDFNNIQVNGAGLTGGLVGLIPNIKIDKVNATDFAVTSNGGYIAGGLVALVTNDINGTPIEEETNIANVSIKKLNVQGKNGSVNIGGLVGQTMNPTIKAIELEDINIANSGGGLTGGLVGIITKPLPLYSRAELIAEGKFEDITISKSETGENSIVGAAQQTGILLGFGRLTTSNININSVLVDGTLSSAVGTIGQIDIESDVKDITLNDVNIKAQNGRAGLVAGFSQGKISSSNVTKSSIESTGNSDVGGIVGAISKPGSSQVIIDGCNVTQTQIKGSGAYVGGIVGMSNNNITNCTIKDSQISSTGAATGGVLGHGSNYMGTDVTIEKCNVIDTNIEANTMVGGISGGAVIAIKDCYVGSKENTLSIKGKNSVGGIIGDAGIIYSDPQAMLTLTGNKIENTAIEIDKIDVEEQNLNVEMSDIEKMIGTRNRFAEGYEGAQTESISSNDVINCIVNII